MTIHDVSDFPIVRLLSNRVQDGYAEAWCSEMNVLCECDKSFVLIYPAPDREEGVEDRRKRVLWMKANRELLVKKCLALITVEPDAENRAALESMLPSLVRAFGTPQAICPSQDQAESLAHRLLDGETLTSLV